MAEKQQTMGKEIANQYASSTNEGSNKKQENAR
ncbi:hypothetical protein QE382_004090 [Sphingobacterium zeae]|uniref:Uncharacterized protein n=1 Tax=Sphingobacterium zeae TaxID=1776859 RepID=A0ABU0UB68_9SPHI|nr:hypothetical protein [Sphingobacterium zeae]